MSAYSAGLKFLKHYTYLKRDINQSASKRTAKHIAQFLFRLAICAISIKILLIGATASASMDYVSSPMVTNSIHEDVPSLITRYALKWSIPRKELEYIIEHESNFNPLAIGDMDRHCRRTGRPVRAKGLSQITDCFHEEISDAQAFNSEFAINFLAENLSKGHCYEWTVCRNWEHLQ